MFRKNNSFVARIFKIILVFTVAMGSIVPIQVRAMPQLVVNTPGTLDITFDGEGKVFTDFGNHKVDNGKTVAIQSDGKIVVAGYRYAGGGYDGSDQIAVSRYIGDMLSQTRYVKWDASGDNNGTSWANAYTDLQSALSAAASGDEIWVAAGNYKPTTDTDRAISFNLKNGVKIYGGFAGTETLLAQRNPATNVTTLNGDIGVPYDPSDNSYHVISAENVSTSTVLDGFTIKNGNANGGAFLMGGGMINTSSSPTLANLTFSDNMAASDGGGMFNHGSSEPTLSNVKFSNNSAKWGGGLSNFHSNPTLINVTFYANGASDKGGGMNNASSNPGLTNVIFWINAANLGGGMHNSNSSPTLTNVLFSENTAYSEGGGMRNLNSSNPVLTNVTFAGNSATVGGGSGMSNNLSNPTLTNVTFSNNIASTVGGGIANVSSNPTLKNVILWGDTANSNLEIYNASSTPSITYSIVQGGYAGTGNLDLDPKLGPLQDNGGFTETMALGAGSPAINAGTNTGCPATDQRGVSRLGGQCDIGAYEYRVDTTFEDVPWDHWAWSYIEGLYNAGVTSGCSFSPKLYCPGTTVTRDQMAVFLLKAKYGSGHIPPTPTGVFQDVPTDYWAAAWIEQLAAEGITSGCNVSPKLYCPATTVTRDQMAVFLLKAEHGSGYTPPTSTGVFQDVATNHWAASWVERLAAEGITGGCSTSPKLYCPAIPVSRDQMAVFLDKTFGIPLP